jgi:CubicO group peptidase (beta-lactamase class C family)
MMTAPLVLLATTLQLQVVDAQTGMDPERLALIPTRLQEFVEEGQIAGAVMVLARHDGIVLLEAVGYQDLETRTPMRTDAIFRMASVAKPMTALGIMVLQEEGRLSIWDRVGRHLPDLRNLQAEVASERPRPVTLQQLMTHTSGMASEGDLFEQDFFRESLADVVATYATKPLAFPPGTRFIYSSPGFDILGRVIEVVSGTSYEAFMEERVFGPLGMEDSGFFVPPEHRDRIPSFYRIEDDRLQEGAWPNSYSGDLPHEGRTFPAPAFGLYTTAPDLGALLQMMLSGGTYDGHRILSRASVTAMTVDRIRDDEIAAWGLGWMVSRQGRSLGGPLASSRAYGHGGSTGVYVWVDPENDLAGVFLTHQVGQESASARNAFMTMAAAAVVDR